MPGWGRYPLVLALVFALIAFAPLTLGDTVARLYTCKLWAVVPWEVYLRPLILQLLICPELCPDVRLRTWV